MRDDLLDAQAAIDWAIAQLPRLQDRVSAWNATKPYRIVGEEHPEVNQTILKLRDIKPLPLAINVETGAVINSIWSSLDLLAASLALRNGKTPSQDTHFPIYGSQQCSIDPIRGIDGSKCKKWLSESERIIIKSLKPYRGGNEALFALHQLDIIRKHTRLVDVHLLPTTISVDSGAMQEGLGFPPMWQGFKENAVVAWHSLHPTKGQFQIVLEVSFNETGLLPMKPVETVLRDFASLTQSIINLFNI